MKRKIVEIFVMLMMFSCPISIASNINIENSNFESNTFPANPLGVGDTFLNPPWTHGGDWTGETNLIGEVDGEVTTDGEGGDIWLFVQAWGIGHAWVDGFITHHPSPNYVAPRDGYYDFTFTYRYYGFIDIDVFYETAFVDTDILLRFNLRVMSEPNSITKEITLDEDTHTGDFYTDWDNTIEVTYSDIYVTKGTGVFLSATSSVDNLHATAFGEAVARGEFDLHGELLKIKIVEPSPPSDPPNKPSKPNGPSTVQVGNSYVYTSITTDPDGDNIYYLFDWGDGSNSGWKGPYYSGITVTAKNTWHSEDTYKIKVKAKDVNGKESDWSDPLSIDVVKTRSTNNMNIKNLNMIKSRFLHIIQDIFLEHFLNSRFIHNINIGR